MSQLYPKGKDHLLGKSTQVNLLTDPIKIAFYDGTYSAAHEFVADLIGADIVARSGALSGKTLTLGTFDANDITLTAVTGPVFPAVFLYKDSGADASSVLLAWYDVPPFTPTGSNVTAVFNASGLFSI